MVDDGVIRWRLPVDLDFISFAFMVNTAPTGLAAIFDIDLNGTAIYTGGALAVSPVGATLLWDGGLINEDNPGLNFLETVGDVDLPKDTVFWIVLKGNDSTRLIYYSAAGGKSHAYTVTVDSCPQRGCGPALLPDYR